MPNHKHPLRVESVVEQLNQWREATIAELRDPATHENALERKRQLDDAIACLEFCERHQIWPDAYVIELPPTRTRTPSSEYRVIEDHESDNRDNWTELTIDGGELRPAPGDKLLSDVC